MPVRRQHVDSTGGDEEATSLSACCLLHCLAWPFLFAIVPGMIVPSSELLHPFLGALSVPISFLVLGVGYDFHRTRLPVLPSNCGIVPLAINIILPLECCSAVTTWASRNVHFSEINLANRGAFLMARAAAVLLISAYISKGQLLAGQSPRWKHL